MKKTLAQHAAVGSLVRMDSQDDIPTHEVKSQHSGFVRLAELDWENQGEEIDQISVSDTATLFVVE